VINRHLLKSAAIFLYLAFVATANAASGSSAASDFCDRAKPLSASQQDRVLQFAAVVRSELAATKSNAVVISRSGLDLSRFHIRYSHAALAWRAENETWTARQLYYACDESRPRIFDQGLAGFAMGIDNAALGYISVVKLPADAEQILQRASNNATPALRLLAPHYSANAYAFGLQYQNCNQWLIELLATAWGGLADGDDLRERAQNWLRAAAYMPKPVEVDSRWLMFASGFVPLIHLDDHPEEDRFAMKLKISLPASIEDFIRERFPGSERIEICHDSKRVVVHRGWSSIADGCVPGEGDRIVYLDE